MPKKKAKSKPPTTTIRLTTLNNKSRQGQYIYIKQTKKRGAYFKLRENTPIDAYKQYYTDKYIKNKPKGTVQEYTKTYTKRITKEKTPRTPISRQADRYLAKIKRTKPVQQLIKTGITNTNITNAQKTTNKQIHDKTKELLKDLVLDKKILDLLVTRENIKKIKSRLEYRITFKDKDGDTIGTSGAFNKTPQEVINDMKKMNIDGEEVVQAKTPTLNNKLNKAGYQKYQHRNDGKIRRTEVNIILRKGK